MRVKSLLQATFVVVIAISGYLAVTAAGQASAPEKHTPVVQSFFKPPVMNGVVPDITVQNQVAENINFSSFQGKVVLVNLWATWCPPCVKELPSLDALQGELGDQNFEVVAIALENADIAKIADFYRSHGITRLKIYLDNQRMVQSKWPYDGLPTSLLINEKGEEVGRFNGPTEWDSEAAMTAIRAHLPEPIRTTKE